MNIVIKEILSSINPNKKGFKKKLLSFTFFLFISTMFWFLNVLGEKYTETISYPVKYINLPQDKEVTSVLPKKLTLKVTTSGYDLLKFYMRSQVPPIHINYNSENVKIISNYKYLLTKRYSEDISLQLSGAEINAISPDSIKFKFQQIVKKKVPIQALVTYKIEKGFVNKGQMYSKPDSVEIKGSKSTVDRINEIYTGVVDLGTISSTTKRNIALKKIKGVKYKTYRTNVFIPIEQSTEKIIDIPIQSDNQVDGDYIKLIPNSIKLSYQVGLSQYTNISSEQFLAIAVYSDSTKSNKVLRVELKKYPENIFGIEYTPNFVEYIKETND